MLLLGIHVCKRKYTTAAEEPGPVGLSEGILAALRGKAMVGGVKRLKKGEETVLEAGEVTRAALGLRAHSGWAALVAVAGSLRSTAGPPAPSMTSVPGAACVIIRRRIELAAPGIPKQPYHAAAELGLAEAEELLRRCADGARSLAQDALRTVIDELQGRNHEVVGCGILLAAGRPATTLANTLASHALIHAAEGELFRDALVHAAETLGLPVARVRERDLFARGAAEFGLSVDELERRVTAMGRVLGPPWRQDEKSAALVGWLALDAGRQEITSVR
jgi:hypothetical protein